MVTFGPYGGPRFLSSIQGSRAEASGPCNHFESSSLALPPPGAQQGGQRLEDAQKSNTHNTRLQHFKDIRVFNM